MSPSQTKAPSLRLFVECLKKVPDPRSKYGTYHPIRTILAFADLQNAFAEFVNALVADTVIVAAVDGKTAKQMKDKAANPLLMLNVFAHKLKLHLASWSVDGDKTNEPGCLKKHLEELSRCIPV